jgi:DNA polymerase elongation subunit (family B)
MYRNIVYSPFDKKITLFTWDSQGNRITEEHDFEPYLYIEDTNGNDGVSIFNSRLRKLVFKDSFKRKEFVSLNNKTFYNLLPEQQFLIERYRNQNQDDNFSMWPLKNFLLDIETFSENGFPDPQKADDPINLISVHDSLTDGIYTFGLQKEYYTSNEKVIYKCYENEMELIKGFLRFWRKDFPDIVSGWYSDGFDLPYLCNRINRLYKDPEACNRLSPVDRVYRKENVKRRLQDYKELWSIVGVTHIDYQYAYKVFTREPRESYALNAIGEEELGKGKLQHNAVSLSELARNNWYQFVDYNIQDVNLLVALEDKLNYLKTCRNLAYRGFSPFISALSTVGIVTGVAAHRALKNNKIISTFTPESEKPFEGGFVKDPQIGIQKSLLYFDANSLYPNTIVTLNISPETKMGKILSEDSDTVEIETINKKIFKLSQEQFKTLVNTEKLCRSKSNILFSQKNRGIFSDIIEEIYAERVSIKKELKNIEMKLENIEKSTSEYKQLYFKSQQLDLQQYTIKIFLNRIYGYFAEKHSPIYDIDLASSVTNTGQSCIKEASRICNNHIKNTYDLDYDAVVMNDTDSVVLTIQPILDKMKQSFLIDDNINPYVYIVANEIKKIIDTEINEWAKTELKSDHCTYEFKRENISSSGIFLAKKHYILNIRDDDDRKVDKFKYKGVEVVKTSTPKKVKPLIKYAVETLIKRGDKKEIENILKDTYEQYQIMSIEDLAMPRSLNGYDKYFNKSSEFKMGKGTPIHVKGSIYYNLLLKKLSLDKKYESLKSGGKIKFTYVLPNTYNLKVIAFTGNFPDEFKNILTIDKDLMFEKTVLNPIKRVFEAINWEVRSPLLQEKVDLLDMFGA